MIKGHVHKYLYIKGLKGVNEGGWVHYDNVFAICLLMSFSTRPPPSPTLTPPSTFSHYLCTVEEKASRA
jgi:hypothetical protein